VRRAPCHAGRLHSWERVAFASVFALMAAFVAAVTVSAAKARDVVPTISSARQGLAGAGATSVPVNTRGGATEELDKRLAAALRPVLRDDAGQLAVGVINTSTGAEALYNSHRHFHAASIVNVDILAALLLKLQRTATPLSDHDAALAAQMIEDSNAKAAGELGKMVGRGKAVEAADAVLGLRQTSPVAGYWGLSSTTVADQVRLLTDLTSGSSPLNAVSRGYELRLMATGGAGQRWGVSAAASPGTTCAVMDGWLAGNGLWLVNSIGVIHRDGQELLIAVLSRNNRTEAGGIARVKAAAVAAAMAVTQSGS
jgi:hypothetical protein